ncbi:hydantoinase/oxoprolinase family protein [Acidisoma cellulosilytica]|uniref:Hydantoinase/oxoprolinase family protein n=1 Tax=Acidisoma cellulosilyticum TaxID=2802395 RepID=A0A963Z8B4_9PROT|nr:hydantoinase/oxoprolinase family protein [Acidisoma cellulosilyticum]MCB8883703.1 hydantoinase/oxoprolinase family protein [Acidisoma cellulosilyticum]
MRRIGVDTGGSFTDCVLIDDALGTVTVEKVPSQPAHPERAILDGIMRLVAKAGLTPADIGAIVHGTTIATNIVIEGTYATAGILATAGCRDVIEIGTQQRPQPYDLLHRPKPVLVPRDRRLEVAGRIAADGAEVEALDETAARQAITALAGAGVQAIAVTGLFSFVAPAHETRLAALVSEIAPEIYVVASSDVSREMREYPRFATTVVNAALAPKLDPYIRRLQEEIRRQGFAADLYVMQSSGGIATAQRSMGQRAHHLVLSGPAAGIIGGLVTSRLVGIDRLVTLDVGGTSADIGILAEGQSRIRYEMPMPNGMPLHVPNLEIETIGAGGGSIAWIDAGGALQVGPRSAGARPGPVCFGLGGTEPTVTDAQLVLRRLNPAGLLGGALTVDRDAAVSAVGHLAERLGLGVEQAALGIVAVMEANMAGAIMRTAARHGDDLRDFALIAAGGAGGLSVVPLAIALGMPRVVIPPHPGLLSAAGLLAADLRHDLSVPVLMDAAKPDAALVARHQADLEAQALAYLAADGIPPARRLCEHALDIRYFGQEYAVTLPVQTGERADAVLARFHDSHARIYGHSAPGTGVELTAIRVTGRSLPQAGALPMSEAATEPAAGTSRAVWFEETGGYVETAILDRFGLLPGQIVAGPAIIEQLDSTTVLPPGWTARAAAGNCLIIERMTP